jgi:hypothetical protein
LWEASSEARDSFAYNSGGELWVSNADGVVRRLRCARVSQSATDRFGGSALPIASNAHARHHANSYSNFYANASHIAYTITNVNQHDSTTAQSFYNSNTDWNA